MYISYFTFHTSHFIFHITISFFISHMHSTFDITGACHMAYFVCLSHFRFISYFTFIWYFAFISHHTTQALGLWGPMRASMGTLAAGTVRYTYTRIEYCCWYIYTRIEYWCWYTRMRYWQRWLHRWLDYTDDHITHITTLYTYYYIIHILLHDTAFYITQALTHIMVLDWNTL